MTRPLLLASAALLLSMATGCDKKGEAPPAAPAAPTQPTATAAPEQAQQAPLKEGDAAPEVMMTLQDGKQVSLASFRGRAVAVYFYPKDATPGCTVEAQGLRDSWADLQKGKVAVIGVSEQDADSHRAFIAEQKLPYDLAVDTDGHVARAFGVPVNGGYASRQTFLIGKDGKIAKVWRQVNPSGHAAEILAAVKAAG